MMKFKAILLSASLLCGIAGFAQLAPKPTEGALTWYTDIVQANTISKKENKPIFAFFTGSDWCGWCRKLQADVFSKPEFVEWAKKNVVLLELDFPRNKPMEANLVEQNRGLQQALGVRGYPTVWLINLNQTEKGFEILQLGSLGYPSGATPGQEQLKFLSSADQILLTKTN